jgi:hypothetical protein
MLVAKVTYIMLLEPFIFQELIQNRYLLIHCSDNTKKLLDSRTLDWTRLGRCAPAMTLESDLARLDAPGLCWWVRTLVLITSFTLSLASAYRIPFRTNVIVRPNAATR